jgi:PAS domain S-box-containing protein
MSQDSVTKTILLVEDEALLAMATQMVLQDNGYDVVHVSTGEAAIEAVQAGGIDLILMDIDLGRNRMDGTETAEKILEEQNIPIIFHTSHAEREMVERVKGITRYGYVLKSAGEFVLLEAIQMAFELFGAHRQIAEKEERYRHWFDYNRSSVAVLRAIEDGQDFIFVDYNRTAEAVDGIRKEEAIGRRVTQVFPGAEAFGILEVFRDVWKTGESKTHADAFYQDERISGWRESFVYRIPSGEIVSVYRDVTEEKETEGKLHVASRELQCLYQVSRLVDTEGTTLPAILQGTVELLPRYIGEVGKMSVRLTVRGSEYATDNFAESGRQRTFPIVVRGKTEGQLEIYCKKPDAECIKQEFLEGFDLFLDTLTERLGKVIERFEAVEELQERTEDYRHILESIGDGVITTDLRGRITRTNHVARQLLGCPDTDLRNRPLSDAFTLEDNRDGRPLPNPVEAAIATDEIITLSNHTKLVSKWGRQLQIADSVAPVHDEKGETRGAVLVFRDETEKYEREKRLRESEERHRRLFENMAEGFLRANTQGEIVLVNQAAVELCGYDSVADLTGRPMTDLYVDPTKRSALLTQLTEDGQLRNREFLLKKKNGDTIWTLCNIKLLLDDSGGFCGTEAMFRDYTDKKTVEIEREKHERFLDSILDAIQDPVSVHDADLNIKKANRIVQSMFSDREKFVGEKCYTAYFGRGEPCEDCPIVKTFATGRVHSCLKEFPGSGEGKQYFELFAYPIIDDQGNVESVVEYARNITELKRNEEELVRTKEQLHKMLQVLPEGFVMVNVEGEITYANDAAGKILEVYKDKITGSYYNDRKWKQIDEGGNPYPLEELPLALTLTDKREVHNLVHGIVAPDGETKWLSVNSAPLLYADGEMSGAIASFRNISEQKSMETALRESEAYYRNVLQFLPVYVLDREYRYLQVNDLAADLVHMEAEELVGKKITDLFPGITETDFYQIYERVMDSRKADSISAPFTLPDGTPGLYQVHVLPCPEGIQCIAVDITERKRIEDRLRIQQKYEKAIAAASKILLSTESERKAIRTALGKLRDVTNVSRIYVFENFHDPVDGLCMRQTYEVCAPGLEPEIDNPLLQHVVYKDGFSRWREALSSRKAIQGNVKNFPKEERDILEPQGIVSMLVLPLFVNGEWRGFIGYDQTDRECFWTKSETLLLQTACDLFGGYLGRIESDKVIQRQLQEKELLIRETHHRIKNNFSSVAGLLSLQAEGMTNAEARAILAQATGRVTSMSDLYDRMLSSNDVRVVSAAPYLRDLIDSVISLVSHQRVVTVEKQIADFTLDSDKLFSLGVIVNELLTNAMKYALS